MNSRLALHDATAFGRNDRPAADPAAPAETSDPLEILARREITIGINLRGLPINRHQREHLALTLNINLDDLEDD